MGPPQYPRAALLRRASGAGGATHLPADGPLPVEATLASTGATGGGRRLPHVELPASTEGIGCALTLGNDDQLADVPTQGQLSLCFGQLLQAVRGGHHGPHRA